MIKKFIPSLLILAAGQAVAQQQQGSVVYTRTVQMIAHLDINGQESVAPQTRTDNFELKFSGNKTLWKMQEQDNNDAGDGGGNGMQIKMMIAGSNDVLYTDLVSKKTTEQKELFDKSFIVDDSIHALSWKITGESKTILNHHCTRAEATRIAKKIAMNMDNGVMTRKEIQDTSLVVAWFTGEIPVSAGPAEYQGQLPGLILEMNIGNGKQVFVANSLSEKVDLADIKEPAGKKHYTSDEFKKEQTKMMDEMQRNMPGKVKFKSN